MSENPGSEATGVSRWRQSVRSLRSATLAMVLGFATLILGGSVSGAMMFANLQLAPSMPLFLPATLLWLWVFFRYVGGRGWPGRTAVARREYLRAGRLSTLAWIWALLAGGLAIAAVMGIAFVTYRFAALPDAAYDAPFDISSLPPWTLVAIFASVALTAAVVEESAFRGYMLSGIQRRYGWIVGIALVTLVFYLAHVSHAYATLAFLPFFLAHGLVFGLLVFYTRSILPGIVLHAASDAIVLPMQYGVVASAGQWDFVSEGWLSLLAGVVSIAAFRKLARVMANEPADLSRAASLDPVLHRGSGDTET
jgi:membrane protease YdiL (CAAX protease family)